MREYLSFCIDGQWVDPVELRVIDVENPATEKVCGRIAVGASADMDKAVSTTIDVLNSFAFEENLGATLVVREFPETNGIVGYGS